MMQRDTVDCRRKNASQILALFFSKLPKQPRPKRLQKNQRSPRPRTVTAGPRGFATGTPWSNKSSGLPAKPIGDATYTVPHPFARGKCMGFSRYFDRMPFAIWLGNIHQRSCFSQFIFANDMFWFSENIYIMHWLFGCLLF